MQEKLTCIVNMGNRKEQSQNPNKYKKAEYLHRQWKHANSTEQKKKKNRYTDWEGRSNKQSLFTMDIIVL